VRVGMLAVLETQKSKDAAKIDKRRFCFAIATT
jgi:hypothetical protein